MWIRSQDKRLLINVSNVYVGGMEDNVEIYQIGEQFNYQLGRYSSLEKALKVLDEIQKITEYLWHKAFQMPADDEVGL
ncbi:hypothetical protein [Holdemanella porci]|uniref:hypothetical protein n=1 Tax=Holdemanella porci TaxID=2652276 RepID=UPI00388D41E1